MLKPLVQYVRDEAAPRWKEIIWTSETLLAVLAAAVFFVKGPHFFADYPKVGDLTTGIIAYASIALGFCIAGLTISLTFPEADFTRTLATTTTGNSSSYSKLLFVFSWTAVVHWLLVVATFMVVLLVDGSSPLLPRSETVVRRAALAFTCGLCVYCLCQFLITLITLSQVGGVYINFLAAKIRNQK